MPLQNRITPFGALIATPARGTLMGNRGCLHDAERRIRRAFAVKRWIICLLEFEGRHRPVMAPGQYTELFFLDEATALAAGHRPCAECQRARYDLFRERWTGGRSALPGADALDAALHAERLGRDGAKRTYRERPSRLPPGTIVADDSGVAWLVHESGLLRWTAAGYTRNSPAPADRSLRVLTPRSTVRVLARGYPVAVHASAG
ncbi:MAG TPA: hypothetical protein VFL90_17345 [Methylomirabilota bacterium]|nr:hypothetical protein [Methylomirabilota bacterium]